MFKHPTPSDFFRILENSSGVDLDWFWRGWFYGTDPVDIAIDEVKWFSLDSKNPDIEFPLKKKKKADSPIQIWQERNEIDIQETVVETDELANDFYNKNDPYEVTILDKEEYQKYRDSSLVEKREKELYNAKLNYYEIKFSNIGGLVMPIILQFLYKDSTDYIIKIPAEIWRMNKAQITKVFATKKEVSSFTLDPKLETADINLHNNQWPRKMTLSKFELFKQKKYNRSQGGKENKMQRKIRADKKLEENKNKD